MAAILFTVALLIASNVFMTFAWYGHLRFRDSPLWIVILASWGIAFFEYCLQVPANRIVLKISHDRACAGTRLRRECFPCR